MNILKIRYLNKTNRWGKHQKIEALFSESPYLKVDCTSLNAFFHTFNVKHFFSSSDSGTDILIKIIKNISEYVHQESLEIDLKLIDSHQEFYLIINYLEKKVAIEIMNWLQTLYITPNSETLFQLADELNRIKFLYEECRLGPSTAHIVQAAIVKDIPYFRLDENSLIQLGWGFKQRRIQAAVTDSISCISEILVQDKNNTKIILQSHGIPSPKGIVVDSIERAMTEFKKFKGPIVIKPLSGNQGRGVSINIKDEKALIRAFKDAQKYEKNILMEDFIEGDDYRLLVVGDKLAAAARRQPAKIMGDGQSSIERLIEIENENPLRLSGHNGVLTKIVIDEIVHFYLSQQNLTLASVPLDKQIVFLRMNGNLSTGGTAEDVTDRVHPDISNKAIMASKALKIDICGIDLICRDITKPLSLDNGCFIELNISPGLRMHISPSLGQPRNIGKEIIDSMFNDNGRIPIVAITGTNGKTTTTKLIGHILKQLNCCVGLTSSDGVYIDGNLMEAGDCSGPVSAQTVLMHPDIEVAVLETARGGLLGKGLGFDKSNVAIITNIGSGDHLGLDFINPPLEMANLKKTLIDSLDLDGRAVLNADDPLLMQLTLPHHIQKTLFSIHKNNPYIFDHRLNQGDVVFYDETINSIMIQSQMNEYQINLDNNPFTLNGRLQFQIYNFMSAIAAVMGLHISPELIVKHLENIENSSSLVPGRFNYYTKQNSTIILDYAHNVDALSEIIKFVQKVSHTKRIAVTSSVGDRKNCVIEKQMHLLGEHFDEVIIFNDGLARGRHVGEIPELLESYLRNTSVKNILRIDKELDAIDYIINNFKKDSLYLFLIDDVQGSIKKIENFVNSN